MKADTDLLICASKDSNSGKAQKARDQGVSVYTYDQVISLPAWKNHQTQTRKQILALAEQRNIDELRISLEQHELLVDDSLIWQLLLTAICQGPLDEMFYHFAQNQLQQLPADFGNIIVKLALDEAPQATAKLSYLLENFEVSHLETKPFLTIAIINPNIPLSKLRICECWWKRALILMLPWKMADQPCTYFATAIII